ncbi:MAG: polyisoprenoid-binding protein YceI [Candidatus Azotimanducaceae bacterium]|jgi:polyisoprenoid-binding protein YceI
MKIIFTLLAAVATSMACLPAYSADYVFDKPGQHVFITFKASHLGYSYILGHFEDFEGTFSHDPAAPENSRVNVTIDVGSLDSDHAERDKHLRGSQYFDVDTHPTITFNGKNYKGTATSGTLTGELNLRGVKKTVDIAVKKIGEGDDPWGGYRSGFEGEVTLNAGDYGLPAWIGQVDVYLIVEGIRQ